MRLGQTRKNKEDAQIDMTSMLDIVFIMLIFFIVTSSFVRESGIDVERPKASQSVEKSNTGVFVAITKNNDIYIDKRRVDAERVQAVLENLILLQPNTSLVIQADEFAFNGVVVGVMDNAKAAGFDKIALATEDKG